MPLAALKVNAVREGAPSVGGGKMRVKPAWGRLAVPVPSGRWACRAGCTRLGRDCGLALRALPALSLVVLQPAARLRAPLRVVTGDVDLMTSGQIRSATKLFGDPPRPGSPLRRCGRSSVVSTEGVDSGPLDRGKAPEACEIGGLGTLAARPAGRCRS